MWVEAARGVGWGVGWGQCFKCGLKLPGKCGGEGMGVGADVDSGNRNRGTTGQSPGLKLFYSHKIFVSLFHICMYSMK